MHFPAVMAAAGRSTVGSRDAVNSGFDHGVTFVSLLPVSALGSIERLLPLVAAFT